MNHVNDIRYHKIWFLPVSLVLVILFLMVGNAHANSTYMGLFNAKYPASSLVGNCQVCHTSSIPTRNPYGLAWGSAGKKTAAFTTIQTNDSDGYVARVVSRDGGDGSVPHGHVGSGHPYHHSYGEGHQECHGDRHRRCDGQRIYPRQPTSDSQRGSGPDRYGRLGRDGLGDVERERFQRSGRGGLDCVLYVDRVVSRDGGDGSVPHGHVGSGHPYHHAYGEGHQECHGDRHRRCDGQRIYPRQPTSDSQRGSGPDRYGRLGRDGLGDVERERFQRSGRGGLDCVLYVDRVVSRDGGDGSVPHGHVGSGHPYHHANGAGYERGHRY